MTRKAVHEVRIPAQTSPGIQVPFVPCGSTRAHPPHFWTADTTPVAHLFALRRYCEGSP